MTSFKNLCQIEHSRHRSPFNFLVNLVSGLIAYAYHPDKPSLGIPNDELKALPKAAFLVVELTFIQLQV